MKNKKKKLWKKANNGETRERERNTKQEGEEGKKEKVKERAQSRAQRQSSRAGGIINSQNAPEFSNPNLIRMKLVETLTLPLFSSLFPLFFLCVCSSLAFPWIRLRG